MRETIAYLRNIIKDPNIASVTPTSQVAIARTCRPINFNTVRLIVEYGPGTGVFTRYLLERMPVDAKLIAFETNPKFAETVQQEVRDPRLVVLQESAENILSGIKSVMGQGEQQADAVISGIPFSMIPNPVKDNILRDTARALRPDGRFLTYQFVPPLASFDSFLYKPLQAYFDVVKVQYEIRNIPPLRLYESRPKEHISIPQERYANR